MTASIVINTYNRARSLERLLPSLAHLAEARFEVIVVNGPSTDDTDAVLARYRDRIKTARCPAANLSQSRNVGIAAAAGEVVVFIDDDALPADTGWLRTLLQVFEQDAAGTVGAVGGPAWHGDTDWAEFDGGWTSDYGEQIFTGEPPAAGADGTRWYRRTVGNNSAFRRSALLAVGGFDERFAYYLDETDVCLRLIRAGYTVVHDPRCSVRHYPMPSPIGPPFIRNRRAIARSDTYFCLKNGSDRLPRRLFETVRRAPRKHFVRELRGLVTDGRISRADLWRLRWQLLRGFAEGLGLGLFAARRTTVRETAPPPFVSFPTHTATRPLSICLLSRHLPPDPHAGGVGRYTFDLARGLHELGHRVTLITESDVPRRLYALGLDLLGVIPARPEAGLRHVPLLAENMAYAEAVLARIDACQREGRTFDVVHASNWALEALGVAQRARLPLTLMLVTPLERVIAAEGWAMSQDLAASIALDQWIIEQATRVCGPSAGVVDSYTAREGWNARPVHPVPLGIYPGTALPRQTHARKRLLFVGRLERRKGIHVLLEALPGLLERHPDWQCDLVGNKAIPAAGEATFAALFQQEHAGKPWLDRVRFHGTVPDADLQRFYRDADVFVAPSLYESFGLIYLEAMQYGVPVVGCRVGGVPEVVTHEQDGLLVEPENALALADALDRLMRDDSLRRDLGARAAQSVQSVRSHLGLAERMLIEYRAAIAAHAAAPAAVADAGRSVVDAALAVLDAREATRGFGLACRASAAMEQGERGQASDLIVQALGIGGHPDYYGMAIEVALRDGDTARAEECARRGFEATSDDSEACLVFAAILGQTGGARRRDPESWPAWKRTHAHDLAPQMLRAALNAIRTGRDYSAIVLLERCLASTRDPSLRAQAQYHRGSALKRHQRLAEARACFESVLQDAKGVGLLADSTRAALLFHLGELDLHDGATVAAIAHFDACLALNPAHRRARALRDEAVAALAAA